MAPGDARPSSSSPRPAPGAPAPSAWRAAARAVAGPQARARHAHWVLRTSDLSRAIKFFKEVFGMKVLRHEEHDAACPITCNGEYDTAWSKTLLGYDSEDRSYALRDIAIRLRRPFLDVVTTAVRQGYGPAETNGTSVYLRGPDGYRFLLMTPPGADTDSSESVIKAGEALEEPFDHIRLMVK